MHWSGKLFVWLLLILWLAALPLMVKLVNIRSAYHEDLVALKETTEKQKGDLETLRAERRDLENTFATTTRSWGNTGFDIPVQTAPNLNTGRMDIGYGTDQGLGSPDPTKRPIVVHGFRSIGDDKFEYMGPYNVTTLGNNVSTVEPQWKVRAGEIESFNLKPGDLTRWRDVVPTAATIDLSMYNKQLVYHGAELEKRRRDEAREDASAIEHEAQLSERMNQLVGVPGGEPGLLDKIVTAEATRNTELAVVDDLRRRIAAAHARQQALKQDVADLEKQLPGAESPLAE